MKSAEFIPLVHLTGFLLGVCLYGLLLWLSTRSIRGQRESGGADRLPLVAALLGLVWNAAALAALAAEQLRRDSPPMVTGLAYGALGFLPAVVIHSVSRRNPSRWSRLIAASGYLIATAGAVLQLTAWNDPLRVGSALRVTTIAFLALTPLLAVTTLGKGRAAGGWWMAALAVFSASGIHMSDPHVNHYSWGMELPGHHASLPLAFALLIYDYRFAFGDLFLKRALAFATVIGMTALVGVGAAEQGWLLGGGLPVYALMIGVALGTSALWNPLNSFTTRVVDRLVLRRPDYVQVRQALSARLAQMEEERAILEMVAETLGQSVGAVRATWSEVSSETGELSEVREKLGGVDALIETAALPSYRIHLDALPVGRRLLSDEYALITWACSAAARRIDAVRIAHDRCLRDAREQEMSRLATQAELRALRAQINPHFLFNALNTIGYLIRSSPKRASETLLVLTNLLRSSLRSTQSFITLDEELRLIRSYLEIERARFEERLTVVFEVDPGVERVRIPSFLLQPLVENAIKHGISRQRAGGRVTITARSIADDRLQLEVSDTGAGADDLEIRRGMRDGIGLQNIQDRLRAHYGDAARFRFDSRPGSGSSAVIVLPSGEVVAATGVGT